MANLNEPLQEKTTFGSSEFLTDWFSKRARRFQPVRLEKKKGITKMRSALMTSILLAISMGLIGCASVPIQLKEAMTVQKTEIERVRELYQTNVNSLLDSIEKYRLAILAIYEKQFIDEYSRAFDLVTKNDGTVEMKKGERTGNPNVDVIHISTLSRIEEFFREQRETVEMDITNRRKQYALIDKNFKNIEDINAAVLEYMESLTRLKNARDGFASGLKNKIKKVIPFDVSLDDLPDPSTIEDLVNKFKPEKSTATTNK